MAKSRRPNTENQKLNTDSQRPTTNDRKPMGTRRKSRELAVQMLFQSDMGKQDAEQVRKTFWSERKEMDESVRGFADDLFRVATQRRAEIDEVIEKHAANWKIDRMAAV